MSKVTDAIGHNVPNITMGREYRLRATYNGEKIFSEAAKETSPRAGYRMMQFNFSFEWMFSNNASTIDLQLGHYNKLVPGTKTKFIEQGRSVISIDDLAENTCKHQTITMLTEPISMEVNVKVGRFFEYRMHSPEMESHYLRSKSSINMLSRLLSSKSINEKTE